MELNDQISVFFLAQGEQAADAVMLRLVDFISQAAAVRFEADQLELI